MSYRGVSMPHLKAALWVHYGDIDEDIDRDNQYLEDMYLRVTDVCKQSQCDTPGNKILFQHHNVPDMVVGLSLQTRFSMCH